MTSPLYLSSAFAMIAVPPKAMPHKIKTISRFVFDVFICLYPAPSSYRTPPESSCSATFSKRCLSEAGFAEATGGRLMLKQGMRAINARDMNDLINFILQRAGRLVAVFV